MDAIVLNKTDTTKFLLPLLVKEGVTYKDLFNLNLSNAYITYSKILAEYENTIIVTYNTIDITSKYYNLFEAEFVDYALSEDDVWIFVYKLDEKYAEDFMKFMTGRYSKLSDEVKHKILTFWEAKENTLLYSVLYKDPKNVYKFIKKFEDNSNAWKHIYLGMLKKVKFNRELYRIPIINREVDIFLYNEGSS